MNKFITQTIGQFLESLAEKYNTHLAIRYNQNDIKLSFKEFNDEVDIVAKGLIGIGLRRGDHIAVWSTNSIEWLTLFFASAKIGVVVVPVNTNFKGKELQYLLSQSDCRALFLSDGVKEDEYIKVINDLCPNLQSSKPGSFNSFDNLPLLRIIVSLDNNHEGMYHFTQLKEFGNSIHDKEYEEYISLVSVHDVALILYTSGTTGFPKGAMLTHFMLVNNACATGSRFQYIPGEKVCISLPFFHSFGISMILSAFSQGAAIVPLLFFSPVKVMETIGLEGCTCYTGVPAMYYAIITHPDFGKYNFSTLTKGVVGGATCPPQLFDEVTRKMNQLCLMQGYGLTETTPVCAVGDYSDPLETRRNSVGTTLPFVEVKIIDKETGKELPIGESGEICIKGYNVMKGYYKMAEITETVIDNNGWLHTGDLGKIDKDGYVAVTGRIKDLIIRGGENIIPNEIENFILTHPSVKDVQIVGVSSKKYGEEVFAYIVKKEDISVSREEIKDFVGQNMAKYKVPSYIAFIEQVPMNASGKVQKYKLKEMAEEHLQAFSS